MENSFRNAQRVIVLGGSSEIARALTKRLCAARAHRRALRAQSQLLDEVGRGGRRTRREQDRHVLFDAEDVTNAAHVVSDAFEKAGGDVDLVVVAVGLLGDQLAQEE